MFTMHVLRTAAISGALTLLMSSQAAQAQVRTDRLQSLGTTQQAVQPLIVNRNTSLADLLAKPDNTVLVMPDGKRTSVAALRNALRTRDETLAALQKTSAAQPTGPRNRQAAGGVRAPGLEMQASLSSSRWGKAVDANTQTRAITVLEEGVHYIVTTQGNRNVSPGDTLTIVGRGFGDTLGEAALVGQFPGGATRLQVLNWRDTEVKTKVPADIRGVLDHDVELQVVTAARRTMPSSKGGHFIAAREEVTLDRGVGRVLRMASKSAPAATMTDDGVVNRWISGPGASTTCWVPSHDDFDIVEPGRGWALTGYWYWTGRQDTGTGDATGHRGWRAFQGEYRPQVNERDPGNRVLTMKFGVWESFSSADPSVLDTYLMNDTSARGCGSWYRIHPILSGPAGTSPF